MLSTRPASSGSASSARNFCRVCVCSVVMVVVLPSQTCRVFGSALKPAGFSVFLRFTTHTFYDCICGCSCVCFGCCACCHWKQVNGVHALFSRPAFFLSQASYNTALTDLGMFIDLVTLFLGILFGILDSGLLEFQNLINFCSSIR